MKPVFQEIIDKGQGDCYSACLATLFGLELADVPKFRRDNPYPKDMMTAVREWVFEKFGMSVVSIQMEDRAGDFIGTDIRIIGGMPGTPCIASGVSPNFEGVMHAVVGTVDGLGNFTLTHDPNPSGKGIEGSPTHIHLFVPMEIGGDPCDTCGKPMVPNINTAIFGVHEQCLELEKERAARARLEAFINSLERFDVPKAYGCPGWEPDADYLDRKFKIVMQRGRHILAATPLEAVNAYLAQEGQKA